MKRPSKTHALGLAVAGLSVAVTASACGASADTNAGPGGSQLSGTLNAAGSTAQQAAMQAWAAGFQTAHPDVTVNYDAVGSGGGRDQFLSGAVQLAGSDAYLEQSEVTEAAKQCGSAPVEIPVYISPIAVVYNLPGVPKLVLDPSTVARIFAGTITAWDDPAIAALNKGVPLPKTAITPVHRSDESGTTMNFTDYLSQAAPHDWTYGAVQDWPLKSGEAASGTSGVVAAVKTGEGTVGYADASQAGGLGEAEIMIGGTPVRPSASAAAKVLDESSRVAGRPSTDLAMNVNRTTSTSGVYPIILVSYQMFCQHQQSQSDANLVKAFASYVVSAAGQRAAARNAGSAPLTAVLRARDQAAIDSVTG